MAKLIFIGSIFILFVFLAIIKKYPIMLKIVLLGSIFRMSIFNFNDLNLYVCDALYILFFIVMFFPTFIKIRTVYNKSHNYIKKEKVIIVIMLFFISLSFFFRLVSHQGIYDSFYYSVLHFLRFSIFIFCIFYFEKIISPSKVHKMISWIIFPALLASVWGIYCYIFNINLSYDPTNYVVRSNSFFANGNQFAAFLMLSFPYIFYLININAKQKYFKYLTLFCFFLVIGGVLVSESKMGYLLLLINSIFIIFFIRKKFNIKIITTLGLIVFLIIGYNANLGRRFFKITKIILKGDLNEREEPRFYLWKEGTKSLKKNWIFGTGFFSTRYFSDLSWKGDTLSTFHMYYLDFFNSNGIFVFLLLVLLLFSPIFKSLKYANRKDLLLISATISLFNTIFINIFENFLISLFSVLLTFLSIYIIRIRTSH